jgi:hypothetical protein
MTEARTPYIPSQFKPQTTLFIRNENHGIGTCRTAISGWYVNGPGTIPGPWPFRTFYTFTSFIESLHIHYFLHAFQQ